jgi:uncharacterized protein YgbK (DUF1537 family)
VTPMDEADLGLHLARQTNRPVGLVDFVAMTTGKASGALSKQRANGAQIISLDVLDQASQVEAGRLIWENRGERLFAVGSQGVEQALVAYWQSAGLIPHARPPMSLSPVRRIACVSGSCSPVTAEQIAHAAQRGFEIVRLDVARAIDQMEWAKEVGRSADHSLETLSAGRDPLLITADGPDDPAILTLKTLAAANGTPMEDINDRIGTGLGCALDRILQSARLERAVIAGGDTSGHAARAMGIYALTATAPLAPGAPLCRASSDNEHAAIEIALKGGQVGDADLFCIARDGSNHR